MRSICKSWAEATVGMNNLDVCPFFHNTISVLTLVWPGNSDTMLDAFNSETAEWLVAPNVSFFCLSQGGSQVHRLIFTSGTRSSAADWSTHVSVSADPVFSPAELLDRGEAQINPLLPSSACCN